MIRREKILPRFFVVFSYMAVLLSSITYNYNNIQNGFAQEIRFSDVVVQNSSNVYYVSPTGNDANDGLTLETAFSTIQKAADTAIAGDTIEVQPGIYNESVLITTSGTQAHPITYHANGEVIIYAQKSFAYKLDNVDYIKIDGFIFCNVTGSGIVIEGEGNIHNLITNNTAHRKDVFLPKEISLGEVDLPRESKDNNSFASISEIDNSIQAHNEATIQKLQNNIDNADSFLTNSDTNTDFETFNAKDESSSSSFISSVPVSKKEEDNERIKHLEYAPNEIIVKFKPGVIDISLERQEVLTSKMIVTAPSIEDLNYKFGLVKIKRIFKIPSKKDRNGRIRAMTVEEQAEFIKQKFPQRKIRAPKDAKIPDLSNVYKLTFFKGVDVREIVEEYKKDPNVEYVQLNYAAYTMTTMPNDPDYSLQWALPKIEADEAWDIKKGSSEVVIAVIDTGLDYSHIDLADNMWENTDEIPDNGGDDDRNGYIDDVRGWDFSDGDNDPMDDNGHGTYCSGIISAVTDNGIGIAGVSWYSKIMGIKGLDADGVGYTVNLAKCIKYAADNGADVIYNGWGIKDCLPSQPLIEDAIRYAHNVGCVVVFPAGNYNDDVIYRSPANMAEVITVAATDQNDKKASFSDYGSLVDVSAPGVDILSLWRNDDYSQGSGTSASASYVAGVAALILSKNPSWSNDEVERCLCSATDNIDFLNPDYDGLLGIGRINAYKAVTMTPQPKIIFQSYIIDDNEGGDGNGQVGPTETVKLTITLKNIWLDATNVSVSLTTTDPYVTITSGNANFGDIAMDSTGDNSSDPFIFSVSEDCPLHHNIVLQLSITAINYSDVDYFTIPIEIFSYHEGWPVTCGWTPYWEQISSPILSDIDEDGDNEVLFGEMSHLYVFNSDGSLVFKYRLDTPADSGLTRSTPAVGDIDGDGDLEIVIAGNQRFFAFHHDGTVVDGWPIDTMVGTSYDPESSGPVLADLDDDGDLEIIAGSMNGNMYVWQGDGSDFPGWPKTLGGYVTFVVSYPAVADIDKDGDLEIITGVSNDSKVYAWHSNGTLVDGWPVSVDNLTFCSTVIGDINGDGNLEIMVSTIGGKTYAFDKDGNVLPGWPFAAGGNALSLGDIDADGLPELVFGAHSKVYALNGDGSLVSGWPIEMDVWGSPALADVDGDKDIDVVVVTHAKPFKIYAFDHNALLLDGWPLDAGSSGGYLKHTPLVGDMDKDGELNLIVVSPDTKAYAWDLPYPYSAKRVEWGMFQHDVRHTGVYQSQIITGAISGTVTLQGRTNQSELITFELRQPGTTNIITNASNDEDPDTPGTQITTSYDGSYTLMDVPIGTFDLTAKSSNTLRAKQENISVVEGETTSNVNFSLLGGDADGNNIITSLDFSIMRGAYGSKPGDENWNEQADFDGNGVVTSLDFSILRGNYGKSGID